MAEVQEPKSEFEKPAIRTMRSDIAEFLKSKRPSVLSIFGPGIKKAEPSSLSRPRPLTRRLAFATLGLGFLVFLGLSVFIFNRFWSIKPDFEVSQDQLLSPPHFFFENTSVLTISGRRTELRSALEQILSRPDAGGSMHRIVFQIKSEAGQIKTMSGEDFFELIEVSPPAEFTANLSGPLELFVFWSGREGYLGILAKTLNRERTMQGLIRWEPGMRGDLQILFGDQRPESSFEAFQDHTYRNIDFRFLALGADGRKGIGYLVFPAKGVVLVNTSLEGLDAGIQRLLEAR